MNFKLSINGDGVRKLDESTFLHLVNQFFTELDQGSYILLEPKMPIDNNIYLQVLHEKDENFVVETRFVFSSTNDFKHYVHTFKDRACVKQLFIDYYYCKLPPVGQWKSEVEEKEESLLDMVKLYKAQDGKRYYAECWANDENEFTVHKGEVGDMGSIETHSVEMDDLPLEVQFERFTFDHHQMGYATIDELVELVIQYRCDRKQHIEVLEEKQLELESLMNECLGWTGNGHCEGGDIDMDTLNIFCHVVDRDIAVKTICECLQENALLKGAVIAYADQDSDQFQVLYPQGAKIEL